MLALWCLGSAKLETNLVCHSEEISQIRFCDDFPIFIVSSFDGMLSIWGHKPIVAKYRNICLGCFLNFEYSGTGRFMAQEESENTFFKEDSNPFAYDDEQKD